jgi:hypothetical protein
MLQYLCFFLGDDIYETIFGINARYFGAWHPKR